MGGGQARIMETLMDRDYGRNALETFSKESPWAVTYPHTTVNKYKGPGVIHILLRRTISSISSPGYHGLSTVQQKPCLNLEVSKGKLMSHKHYFF